MTEFETEMHAAGDALRALADGPGAEAARALSAAFGAAGEEIETALARAAQTGALDFNRMAESILRDLSRIATEAVLSGGAGGNTTTLNMSFAPGTDQRGAIANAGSVSALLARMVSQGGRFL